MIVIDPILEPSCRPDWLYATDEAHVDQESESVVDGLARDDTDLGPDDLGHRVGSYMGLSGDRPQDGQPLRRDLNTVFTEKVYLVCGHVARMHRYLDYVKDLTYGACPALLSA